MSRYFLPLTVRWTRYTTIDRGPGCELCAVRRGASEGTLLDATAEPDFITVLLSKVRAGETVSATKAIDSGLRRPLPGRCPKSSRSARSTASSRIRSVIVDNQYVVKVLRKVTAGIHPEFEIGRFLADVAHFNNAPALLGTVELVEGKTRTALAIVHAFIQNQGDAWGVTGASLDRLLDEQRMLPDEVAADTSEMASMFQRMRQIGRRTAELDRAFASYDIEGFTPEPISPDDSAQWSEAIVERATRVFEMLQNNANRLAEPAAMLAQRLVGQREAINAHIESLKSVRLAGARSGTTAISISARC